MIINLVEGSHRVMCDARFVALLPPTGSGLVEFLSRPRDSDLTDALCEAWQPERQDPHVVLDLRAQRLMAAGPWTIETPAGTFALEPQEYRILDLDPAAATFVSVSKEAQADTGTFLQSGLVRSNGFLVRPGATGDMIGTAVHLTAPAATATVVERPRPQTNESPTSSPSVFDDPGIALEDLGRGVAPEPVSPRATQQSPEQQKDPGPTLPATPPPNLAAPETLSASGTPGAAAAPGAAVPSPPETAMGFREPPATSSPPSPPDVPAEIRDFKEPPTPALSPANDGDHTMVEPAQLRPSAMIDFAAAGIVTIQTSAVVGRNPGQAATDSEEQVVVLRGSEISRRHARIWIDNAELRVQDLGSSNGTVLRRVVGSTHDVPQEPEALTVLVGDALVIGPVEATFVGWKLDD